MIIGYIVGILLGGWFALWLIWQAITLLVRFIYYLTHRKQIKKEKAMAKKEKELNEWQREQRIKEMEAAKKKIEAQEVRERVGSLVDDEVDSSKEIQHKVLRKTPTRFQKILEERPNKFMQVKKHTDKKRD